MTDLKPMEAEPLLRWAGGKRKMVSDLCPPILRHLSRTGGRYIEPFMGGGAIALHLGLPGMLVNDALPELVNLYTQVRDNPSGVAWALSALGCGGVDEEAYYRVRDMRPERPEVQAARMLYLNRLGFNGMYRLNRLGEFNVPYAAERFRESVVKRDGNGADSIGSLFPHRGKFQAVARALATATITCGDFEPVVDQAQAGDVIYADSPYDGAGDMYTADEFTEGDQCRLACALQRAAVNRGAAILHSNADTPLIRSLYYWADVQSTSESRTINSDTKGRQRAACVLAVRGFGEVVIQQQMEMFG